MTDVLSRHTRLLHVPASFRLVVLGVGVLILLLVLISLALRNIQSSLFSESLSRVNIGYWGEHSYVLSIGRQSKQHTVLLFANSHPVRIPGGLAEYRIGALGKLASLEHDQQLYTKAMGAGSGVFIHRFVHESSQEVYYDDTWIHAQDFQAVRKELMLRTILERGSLSLFDRLYVLFALQESKPSQVSIVRVDTTTPSLLLFDKVFRQERKLVQLRYATSDRTAYALSKLLENTGIRVADISPSAKSAGACTIIESHKPSSHTARFLSTYFDCPIEVGDTGLYDVVFGMSPEIERVWRM